MSLWGNFWQWLHRKLCHFGFCATVPAPVWQTTSMNMDINKMLYMKTRYCEPHTIIDITHMPKRTETEMIFWQNCHYWLLRSYASYKKNRRHDDISVLLRDAHQTLNSVKCSVLLMWRRVPLEINIRTDARFIEISDQRVFEIAK